MAYTPSRLGQIKGVDPDDALFLEVFAGEVLEAFDTKQTTEDKQIIRTIEHGKTAQFPGTWKADAAYFTPGTDELTGSAIEHGERIITIEKMLIAHVLVADIDEAKNHYDVRSIYSHQLGEALGNSFDKNSFRGIYKAAGSTHMIYDTDTAFDGEDITDLAMRTDSGVLKGAIYDGAQALDDKDVPSDPRYLAVKPAQFYLTLEDGEFINRDFSGEGSKARATLPWAADLQVVKSNNIPIANDTANAAVPSVLQADYTTNVAAIWHPSAIGTVKLVSLKTETDWNTKEQVTYLVAKYAIGQDILRAEAAVRLRQA